MGIAPADGAILLVVSVRKSGEAVSISVNLRAPIVIDTANRHAWQHVLANPAYSVRHVL
jgi:flagellar assembly factor FliW